jgi:type II secretory pathway pseudopilin PulG
MYLEGQGAGRARHAGQAGFAMAALLVTLGVMAVMMSAAMPVWRHQAQREKEAELVFRGEQYARAVGLYQRKMGPGTVPPNIDALVQQKFLRKKYLDPMVPDGEFQIVPFGGQPGQSGQPGQPGAPQRGGIPGAGRGPQTSGLGTPSASNLPGQPAGFTGGGVMGVVSKSKEASIRIYRGASYYNQWRFVYVAPQPGPGQDGRGGPGRGRGPGQGGGMGPGMGGTGRGAGRGPMGPGGGRGSGQGGRGPAFPFPGGRGGRGPGL